MTAFDINRTSGLTTGRFTSLLPAIITSLAAWNDARITRNSLSKLTARELEDIGLHRGDIDDIADRTAR